MDEEMMRVALAAIEQELRVEPANGNLWLERGRLHRASGDGARPRHCRADNRRLHVIVLPPLMQTKTNKI